MKNPKYIHMLDELHTAKIPPMPEVKPPRNLNLVRDEVTIYEIGFNAGYRAGVQAILTANDIVSIDKEEAH